MTLKARRTEDLRKGRISEPGARYFLTWCTENRARSLDGHLVQATARQAIEVLDLSGAGRVLAGSIMPDHIHLLLELGLPLSVSQVVGKTKSAIARANDGVEWQENFFEHRLRGKESTEEFAFYIFMNPYNAGVCNLEQAWAGWIGSKHVRWTFEEKLRPGGLPQLEWIKIAERFARSLPVGAD